MPRIPPPKNHETLSLPASGNRGKQSVVIYLSLILCALALSREFSSNTRIQSTCMSKDSSASRQAEEIVPKTEFDYLPCQLVDPNHRPENNTRFKFTPLNSWNCQQEVSDQYSLFFINFQIKECPPDYSASTFQLEGSTEQSRIMGHITDRYTLQDGCGIYNASVEIMGDSPTTEGSKTVNIDLYWTSQFRKYSNRVKDIQEAHEIKMQELNATQIQALIPTERMEYLKRHLFPLFRRQLQITVAKQQPLPTHQQPLPDCGTIPIEQWEPVGVFRGPSYNETSDWDLTPDPDPWPFRSARCVFPARTLPQLNELLAGTRTFLLSDSHGENLINEVRRIMCPQYSIFEEQTRFYQDKYDCPFHNNSFGISYRFFRGVYQADMKSDMDAISANLRHGSPKSCEQILGLGLYNVTIMTIPHWLFVYETQEGLDDFLLALKSLVLTCRESHAELMKDHIFLLQSPTARDYLQLTNGVMLDSNPAHSWRGIHNYRLDAFTQKMKTTMAGLVDGIIPAFEMTLARMKTQHTRDGVHLPFTSYRELLHVQVAAIRSAMKYKRGLDLPIMEADDPRARWFAGLPIQYGR